MWLRRLHRSANWAENLPSWLVIDEVCLLLSQLAYVLADLPPSCIKQSRSLLAEEGRLGKEALLPSNGFLLVTECFCCFRVNFDPFEDVRMALGHIVPQQDCHKPFVAVFVKRAHLGTM